MWWAKYISHYNHTTCLIFSTRRHWDASKRHFYYNIQKSYFLQNQWITNKHLLIDHERLSGCHSKPKRSSVITGCPINIVEAHGANRIHNKFFITFPSCTESVVKTNTWPYSVSRWKSDKHQLYFIWSTLVYATNQMYSQLE